MLTVRIADRLSANKFSRTPSRTGLIRPITPTCRSRHGLAVCRSKPPTRLEMKQIGCLNGRLPARAARRLHMRRGDTVLAV